MRWIGALAIEPNDAVTKVARAFVDWIGKPIPGPCIECIDSIRAKNPAALQSIADSWLICALAERDTVAANNALSASGEDPMNFWRDVFSSVMHS